MEQKTSIEILLSPQEGMTGQAELRILIRRGKRTDAVTAVENTGVIMLQELKEGACVPVAAFIDEETIGSIKDLAENTKIRVMRNVYEQYEPQVENEGEK